MQEKFITVFERLCRDTQSQNIPHLQGFWVIHSDDPLLAQWLIDACRPAWQVHQQVIKRIELNSVAAWRQVVSELSSLSLFDDASAIIVTGKHKPDETTLSALSKIKDTPHHLIWCLPKQDKKALNTKALKFFDTQGLIVDANFYDERQRFQLLQFQAKQLGVSLDKEAWQVLMLHTEHNILAAYQALSRLALLYNNTCIDCSALISCLTDGSTYTSFDLSDAILQGNTTKALDILSHLKQQETAPSLILWTLSKDSRIINQIHNHKSPESLGVWRNKVDLYLRAARRTDISVANHWTMQILQIDQAIKGFLDADVWHLLSCLIYSMSSGKPFLSSR